MTKAALEALKNAALASAQPITAVIHKNYDQQVINELYDAASRGAVLSGVDVVLSLMTGDKVFIIRSGVAKLIDKSVFVGTTPFILWNFATSGAAPGDYPSDLTKVYVSTDNSVVPENTWFVSDGSGGWLYK